jgi:plasmid maintenance system antidote protein VapI
MKKGRLKGIIFESGKNQRQISRETKIPETKLSAFINGRMDLTPKEKKSLARVLKVSEAILFDEQQATMATAQ